MKWKGNSRANGNTQRVVVQAVRNYMLAKSKSKRKKQEKQ